MITADPADTTVIVPVAETLAIPAALLLHVPPDAVSVRSDVCVAHTVVVPAIGEAPALTVTVTKEKYPAAAVYEILATPAETPVTVIDVPVVALTDAIVASEELHTPPGVVSVKVEVLPAQNVTPVVVAIAGYNTSDTAPLPVVAAAPLIRPVVISAGLT